MHMKLEDLLLKLGVPEVEDTGRQRFHYTDKDDAEVGGFADVRMEGQGQYLTADLKHWRKGVMEDEGHVVPSLIQSVHVRATRLGQSDLFDVTEVGFDGTTYRPCPRPMIELACAIFHARALDISMRQANHMFNHDPLKDVADEIKAFDQEGESDELAAQKIIRFEGYHARQMEKRLQAR